MFRFVLEMLFYSIEIFRLKNGLPSEASYFVKTTKDMLAKDGGADET